MKLSAHMKVGEAHYKHKGDEYFKVSQKYKTHQKMFEALDTSEMAKDEKHHIAVSAKFHQTMAEIHQELSDASYDLSDLHIETGDKLEECNM